MALTFNVKIGPWSADGFGPYVDLVTVDDPPAELVRLASHAHAAGVLDVTEGLDESATQSQADGEAAYAAAQGTWVEQVWNADGTATPGYWSGGWHVGNQAQHKLDEAKQQLAAASTDEEKAAAEANLLAVDAEIQAELVHADQAGEV